MESENYDIRFPMQGNGESIDGFISRTNGTIEDYNESLDDFRKKLAHEKGVSLDELHLVYNGIITQGNNGEFSD